MLTLTLTTTTDVSSMLDAFARQARLVAGEGPPEAAELDDVKAHVARALDETRAGEEKTLVKRLAAGLPKGVRLVRVVSQRDGLLLTSATTLEFDDVSLVPQVELAANEGQPPLKPFADFTVKREQGRVVLSGRSPVVPEGTGSMSLSLEASVAPTSHNAPVERDGQLTWTGSGFEVRVAFG
jgi:hypothetical protein